MFALSTYNPFPTYRRTLRPFDLMESFFRPVFAERPMPRHMGVKETEDAYLLDCALPGFLPEAIEVTVADGTLSIQAQQKEGDEGGPAFQSESYRQSFTLNGIDEENITAKYEHGVLRVHLPKAHAPDAPAPRRIDIQ